MQQGKPARRELDAPLFASQLLLLVLLPWLPRQHLANLLHQLPRGCHDEADGPIPLHERRLVLDVPQHGQQERERLAAARLGDANAVPACTRRGVQGAMDVMVWYNMCTPAAFVCAEGAASRSVGTRWQPTPMQGTIRWEQQARRNLPVPTFLT